MFDKDDSLFDSYPDVNFDGDSDLEDMLIFEDMLEEEERLTTSHSAKAITEDEDKDWDADDKEIEEDASDDCSDIEIEIPIKISVEYHPPKKNKQSGQKTGIEKRKEAAQSFLDCAEEFGDEDDVEQIKRCRFILESPETAAKYLTENGIVLYSQAVKDNFNLHFEIEEEFDCVKLPFGSLLKRLARHDVSEAIEVWEWCMDHFLPHISLAMHNSDLTSSVLLNLGDYPNEFSKRIISHMIENPTFAKKLISHCTSGLIGVEILVETALEEGHGELAKEILKYAMTNSHANVYEKENLIDFCIRGLSYREDLEPMELFEKQVFPTAVNDADEYIRYRIPDWEKEMREHIEYEEANNERYAYSRRFTWRAKYRDDDIDPTQYDTEKEYLTAVHERKYGWRKYCSNRFGIDPINFETREKYDQAINAEYAKEREERQRTRETDPTNMTVYNFCKVSVSEYYDAPYYYYFIGDLQLEVGDHVIVPFGRDNTPTKARVMSMGKCFGSALPCHVDRIKTVASKIQ